MIRELTGITLPKDTDFLWRYISFGKFVNLLDTESIFFTRADKFDDPLEGFTPSSVKEHYESLIGDSNTLERLREKWRKYVFCSCWHHASEESMAMWEKYHMHNSGIAIKTTVDAFKNCFRDVYDVFIGKIKYINLYEYPLPQNINEMSILYTWYFHKRKHFEHEREFRAILNTTPLRPDNFDNYGNLANLETLLNDEFPDIDAHGSGIYYNIDVNKLIGEVITSPYVDSWFTNTVRSVVKQYGFDFAVNPSTILDVPSETN